MAVVGALGGRRDPEAAERWRKPHLSAARGISSAIKLLGTSARLARAGKERFLGLCSPSGRTGSTDMARAVLLCWLVGARSCGLGWLSLS